MKYYLVYLWQGKVTDICSYDSKEAQDSQRTFEVFKIESFGFQLNYDEVQVIDIVD